MRALVAGFGNVLLGDDGFGVAVVKRLVEDSLPAGVQAIDVGIGGMNLVLKLMEGFDQVIVVDAVRTGREPGTLCWFTPDGLGETCAADPHTAEPAGALQLAAALGVLPPRVTVLGCEPADCDLGLALSPRVDAAVAAAAERVRKILGANDGRAAA